MATPREVIENSTGVVIEPRTWLRSNRLFYLDPTEDQLAGWYFKVRGPRLYGPYQSRGDASAALDRMLDQYLASKATGGR